MPPFRDGLAAFLLPFSAKSGLVLIDLNEFSAVVNDFLRYECVCEIIVFCTELMLFLRK